MSNQLSFDGRVVIVTGAGNGLGRLYALFFASRGAKVVVNHFSEQEQENNLSDMVVNEIMDNGGQGVANNDNIDQGEKIVKTALDTFGRIDIAINRMTKANNQSFLQPLLKQMQKQNYGRILNMISEDLYEEDHLYQQLAKHNHILQDPQTNGHQNIISNTITKVKIDKTVEFSLSADEVQLMVFQHSIRQVANLCHESCTRSGIIYDFQVGYICPRLQALTSTKLRLDGKVVLISGSNNPFEEQLFLSLNKKGAHLVLYDSIQSSFTEYLKCSAKTLYYSSFKEIIDKYGRIDILIISEVQINKNQTIIQQFMKQLNLQKKGRIINFADFDISHISFDSAILSYNLKIDHIKSQQGLQKLFSNVLEPLVVHLCHDSYLEKDSQFQISQGYILKFEWFEKQHIYSQKIDKVSQSNWNKIADASSAAEKGKSVINLRQSKL